MRAACSIMLGLGHRKVAFDLIGVDDPLCVEDLELVIDHDTYSEMELKGFCRVQNVVCVLDDHLLSSSLIPST